MIKSQFPTMAKSALAGFALTAAALGLVTGADETRLWDAVGRLQPVRGRLERAVITPTGAEERFGPRAPDVAQDEGSDEIELFYERNDGHSSRIGRGVRIAPADIDLTN